MDYLKQFLVGIVFAGISAALAFVAYKFSIPIFAALGTPTGITPLLVTAGLLIPALVTGFLSVKTIFYDLPKDIYEDVCDWFYYRKVNKNKNKSYNNYNSYNSESNYNYEKNDSYSNSNYSESKKSSTHKNVKYSYSDMDTNFIGNKINDKSDDMGR